MEDDDNAALSVGFRIDFHDAAGQLRSLDDIIGKTAADTVRQFQRIEAATKGSIDLGGATARITAFGGAATREMENVRRATASAEKSGEAMVRQLDRQVQSFGKTTSEIRQMRAELRATEAESRGLTELAGRIRAASSALDQLEASGSAGAGGVRKSGSAMAAIAPQAQDMFTQISMGTNVLNVLAIQGGQVASQMIHMDGVAGKFASFMMGPWGLALTAATLVAGALSSKLLDNADAAEKAAAGMKQFQDRQSDIGNFINATTGKLTEQNRTLVLNAVLTRQAQIAANDKVVLEGRQQALRTARATLNRNAPLVGASSAGSPIFSRETDPAVQRAIAQAGGNVDKLALSIGRLARTTRPDLKKLALDLSNQAGAAILAQRENEKLGKELRALNGDTRALAQGSAALIDKQVALATATTPLEKAQARLALVQQGAQAAEKAGGAALSRYRTDLTAATNAVKAAEGAQKGAREAIKAHNVAVREQRKDLREAEAAARELQSSYEQMQNRFDPAGAAGREYAEALATIEKLQRAGKITAETAEAWQYGASRQAADRAKAVVDETADALAMIPKLNEIEFKIIGLDDILGIRSAEWWDDVANGASRAAQGMEEAFGRVGGALGEVVAIFADYQAVEARWAASGLSQEEIARRTGQARVRAYSDAASAARGFFQENDAGYKALTTAVKLFRAIEFALSVKSMAQDAIETATKLAKSAARTGANAVEAVSKALASLPFPANIAAGAATVAALAAIGVSIAGALGGGGKNTLPKANGGTGTVLGDPSAKSESIRRGLDALKEVDTLTLNTSREMLSSLRAIETSIGGVASLVVRAGNVNADVNVREGFQKNLIGSVLSKIPLVGGILGGLFGSKTDVIGSGLFGGPQSLGSILDRGFDASYYSDTKKTSKFFGITTGTKYSTSYTGADAGLESQFTLILRQFNDAIAAAAGPFGASTGEIEARLRGFVVNIGKIDLKGLTGAEIEEKLSAVFGAAADQMAAAAISGLSRFQKVGEGTFETLVRVASTVEAVTASLDALGFGSRALGIDAKMGIAAQFESVSAMSSAVQAYADAFYTREEQAAAKQAQLASVFSSLGMVMPTTLAGFRQLVDAQDLTSAAGQKAYATLIQLAPAFADLKEAMEGAKSAADILAERQDLERKLLELRGDTAAIRALDLAKLDASNRALQEQVWAVQDAMEAAKAADELRQAWTSVGDSIMDEVKRIRGLNGTEGGSFASLSGEFNAANAAARAGDQEAARSLPGLSQALLNAAALVATSRQELDRVQAQTAASLEETYRAIEAMKGGSSSVPTIATLTAAAASQAAVAPSAANDDMASEIEALRAEIAAMRSENTAGLAAAAGSLSRIASKVDDVTAQSGGDAISIVAAA